jgi:hypothetical protein
MNEIIQFISPQITPLTTQTKDNLQCASILTNSLTTEATTTTTNNIHSTHTTSEIEFAYISDDLVCKVTDILKSSGDIILKTIQPVNYNISCLNGISLHKSTPRKCKIRYTKRTYLTPNQMKHPIVFLASNGSNMINTRLLIEHASGIYSGAMETNTSLKDIFPAESFCGQRMSLIHASPSDVTIKNLPSGSGVVSMTNIGNKKCNKGMISGFNQVCFVFIGIIFGVYFFVISVIYMLLLHIVCKDSYDYCMNIKLLICFDWLTSLPSFDVII